MIGLYAKIARAISKLTNNMRIVEPQLKSTDPNAALTFSDSVVDKDQNIRLVTLAYSDNVVHASLNLAEAYSCNFIKYLINKFSQCTFFTEGNYIATTALKINTNYDCARKQAIVPISLGQTLSINHKNSTLSFHVKGIVKRKYTTNYMETGVKQDKKSSFNDYVQETLPYRFETYINFTRAIGIMLHSHILNCKLNLNAGIRDKRARKLISYEKNAQARVDIENNTAGNIFLPNSVSCEVKTKCENKINQLYDNLKAEIKGNWSIGNRNFISVSNITCAAATDYKNTQRLSLSVGKMMEIGISKPICDTKSNPQLDYQLYII